MPCCACGDVELVAYHPGVLQGDHVVDVEVRGGGPGGPVVGREPRPRRRRAGAVGDHIGAVPLQDILADMYQSISVISKPSE